MKALTIKQPWAYLICAGWKDVENRTWKTSYRGQILIHASKKPEVSVHKLDQHLTGIQYLQYSNGLQSPEGAGKFLTGAIIGMVTLVDCIRGYNSIWAERGAWHWIIKNPILFDDPILNIKGRLSLWEYENTNLRIDSLYHGD